MVPFLSMVFMGISAVLSVGLPLGVFLFLRKKHGLKAMPMLMGAAAFIVFALILEQMMHMLVLRPDANGMIELKNNPPLYVLYGVFAAGIFEESARLLSFLLLRNKYRGIATGLSYGIGHGGIEAVLLVGLSMVSNLVVSVMINSQGIELPLTEAQMAALTQPDSFVFLVGIFERIPAIAMQLSLSVLVWFAVEIKSKRWLFPAAIVLHAAVDVPAVLMQVGVIKNVFLIEGLAVASAAALAAGTVYMYRKIAKTDESILEDGAI